LDAKNAKSFFDEWRDRLAVISFYIKAEVNRIPQQVLITNCKSPTTVKLQGGTTASLDADTNRQFQKWIGMC
jgi:hypothetical protein